jgi:hypothetical protein
MREIVAVCLTCVIGWSIAQGLTSAREVEEMLRVNREAQLTAEASWRNETHDIGAMVYDPSSD